MDAALSRADNAAAVIMAASARGCRRPVVEHCAAGSRWILTAFHTKQTQQTATAPEEIISSDDEIGKDLQQKKSCRTEGTCLHFPDAGLSTISVSHLQSLGP